MRIYRQDSECNLREMIHRKVRRVNEGREEKNTETRIERETR